MSKPNRAAQVIGVLATRTDERRRRDRVITARDDGPKVIVLTTFALDDYAYAALRAGASGFLLKDASAADVIAAIRAVHSDREREVLGESRRVMRTPRSLGGSTCPRRR
jgi:DNA-binding NarL/FixJ family response regulator